MTCHMIWFHRGGVVYIINHELGDKLLVTSTDSRISLSPSTAETTPTVAMWEECTEEEKRSGFRVRIQHNKVTKVIIIILIIRYCVGSAASERGSMAF